MGPISKVPSVIGVVSITCCLLFFLHWAESGARLDHGSSCSSTRDCESRNVLLQCDEGVCICPTDQDTVFLDPETELCSATVGSSCHRTRRELNSEEELNPVKHYVPCLRNSICARPARVCECDPHHYAALDKLSCPLQKAHGEVCTEQLECDTYRYLTCVDGSCGCPPEMDYHEKLQTCFVRIGQNCSRDVMHYNNPVFPGRYDSCPLNAECHGVCTCRPYFTVSTDGTCGRDYGSRCDLNQPCSDIQFSCQNQKCGCKYPLHQYFEVNTGRCLSRVPGPCTANASQAEPNTVTSLDPASIYCVLNAACVQNENDADGHGQCRCGRRYQQDKDGFCLKPHGYECELDRECSNMDTPLVCINNQCSCPDILQDYDRETGSCRGKIGSRCPLTSSDLTEDERPSCVANAYCKPFGAEKDFGLVGECVPNDTIIAVTSTEELVTESPVPATTTTESPVTVTVPTSSSSPDLDDVDYVFPDEEIDHF